MSRKKIKSIRYSLPCKICGRSYSGMQSMYAHMVYAHGKWPYGCSQCLRRFYRKSDLVRHCVQTHSAQVTRQICSAARSNSSVRKFFRSHVTSRDKWLYGCAQCPRRFYAKRVLVRHCVKSHRMEIACFASKDFDRPETSLGRMILRRYQCLKCGKICASENVFEDHCRRPHDYGCACCQRRFITKNTLISHCQEHLKLRILPQRHRPEAKTRTSRPRRIQEFDATKRPFGCSECFSFFGSKQGLEGHLMCCHKQVFAASEAAIPCQFCGQHFEISGMIYHMRSKHSDLLSFSCCYCHIKFLSEDEKYDHEVRVHRTSEFIKCDFCAKKFFHLSTKEDHVTNCHLEKASSALQVKGLKLKCQVCADEFRNAAARRRHLQLRHPEQAASLLVIELQCDFCSKLFNSRSERRTHMRVAHLREWKRVCEHCGEWFRFPRWKTRHVARDHKSDYCEKIFAEAADKTAHVRSIHPELAKHEEHRGEVWITCGLCSERFPNWTERAQHLTRDHAAKPQTCEFCSREYRSEKLRRIHVRKIHADMLGIERPSFACQHCPRVFGSHCGCRYHEATAHFRRDRFTCHICSKSFAHRSLLRLHLTVEHDPRRRQIRRDISSILEKEHPTTTPETTQPRSLLRVERFPPLPERTTRLVGETDKSLPSTAANVIDGRRFSCQYCPQTFATKADVLAQVTVDHRRWQKCPICDENFTSVGAKLEHLRLAHPLNPPGSEGVPDAAVAHVPAVNNLGQNHLKSGTHARRLPQEHEIVDISADADDVMEVENSSACSSALPKAATIAVVPFWSSSAVCVLPQPAVGPNQVAPMPARVTGVFLTPQCAALLRAARARHVPQPSMPPSMDGLAGQRAPRHESGGAVAHHVTAGLLPDPASVSISSNQSLFSAKTDTVASSRNLSLDNVLPHKSVPVLCAAPEEHSYSCAARILINGPLTSGPSAQVGVAAPRKVAESCTSVLMPLELD